METTEKKLSVSVAILPSQMGVEYHSRPALCLLTSMYIPHKHRTPPESCCGHFFFHQWVSSLLYQYQRQKLLLSLAWKLAQN